MKNAGLLSSGEVDGEKNEIIVYQPEGGEFHIEVRVDQDTVWLTQAQNRTKRVSQNQASLIL
ncbi:hypothetical protein [Hallerella succinigenes]|uniref:hypothetical protein n=1 Tax=Hallerella succinigenes TaxID=1896222 RepID=UPI001F52ED56|nr:hypothetical protein [Hallerella succinigenes]